MSRTKFPLALPSSAELEEAAQELERKALAMQEREFDRELAAAEYFQAAAAYRQVYEERQTREALRAILLATTSKSIFETVFGKDAPKGPPTFGFKSWLARR